MPLNASFLQTSSNISIYVIKKQVRIQIMAKLTLIKRGIYSNMKFCLFEYTPPQAYGGRYSQLIVNGKTHANIG